MKTLLTFILFNFVLMSNQCFADDTILFIGSSSIAKWSTLESDFADFRAVNKGKSGTKYSYVKSKARDFVEEIEPDHIVFYSGDNDISLILGAGTKLSTVVKNFEDAVEEVRAVSPSVPIYVVSVKPTRSRPIRKAKKLNALLEKKTADLREVYYIDVFSEMINDKGNAPKKGVLSLDGIHMNESGYELWTEAIKRNLR